jgi:DNA-binding MarR family transcriptional regulator
MATLDRKPVDRAQERAPTDLPADARPDRGISLGVLDDHLGYLIRRFQVWVFQDFIKQMASIDLRPAQFSVLAVIAANPGLSQSDLSETLGIERARLVRMLDLLEKRGLTRRLPSQRDRRSHALKRAKTLADAHEAKLIEKLGAAPREAMIGFLRDFGR